MSSNCQYCLGYENTIKQIKERLAFCEEKVDFYGDKMNWMQLIDGKYNLGKIWIESGDKRSLGHAITTENGAVAREYRAKYPKGE